MSHFLRASTLFAAIAIFQAVASGQVSSQSVAQPVPPAANGPISCTATLGPFFPMLWTGSAAPYSAVRESSTVQTLADGTRISPKPHTEKFYRDSQGRERTERPLCGNSPEVSEALLVSIRDPVASYAYYLDQQNHIAYRYVLKIRHPGDVPATGSPAGSPPPAANQSERVVTPVQETSEPLGSRSIEGVTAEGKRTTRIIPAGAEDNDRLITIVTESWFSSEIHASVLVKVDDPRRGESSMRLTNIDRTEPDISLFQPPADYKIEDAIDRVTIKYTRP